MGCKKIFLPIISFTAFIYMGHGWMDMEDRGI